MDGNRPKRLRSGNQASIQYLDDMLRIYNDAERHDDGYLCTCALEALPLDPSMLKRRKS